MRKKNDRSTIKNLNLKNFWHLAAVGFGAGLAPKAPGTFGSLVAIPFCMALVYARYEVMLAVAAAVFLIGWKAAAEAEKALGMHDCSSVVIDEILGMLVSVLFFPPLWSLAFTAFVLFRFYDIFKPFPICYLDKKVGGGLGVMLDDLAAGIAACATAHVIFFIFPQAFGISALS